MHFSWAQPRSDEDAMFIKRKTIKHALLVLITVSGLLVSAIGYLAIQNIASNDSQLLFGGKLISKALVMGIFDRYERFFSGAMYTPTPFDSPEFSYADLSNPYFEVVRSDKRVAHFYAHSSMPMDFYNAVSMADFLRDLFPHGVSRRSYQNANVLEMMDAAENGERFLCGNISKMLAQLVQAGGTQARNISLGKSANDGHNLIELWSRRFGKWAVIDPDYNVHYTDSLGIPLSALELYQIAQDENRIRDIRRIAGNSPNTLHNSNTKNIEKRYRNGFAVEFYNRWVDANLPRWHPGRSPSIMAYYIGNSFPRRFYYKYDSRIPTNDIISILYAAP